MGTFGAEFVNVTELPEARGADPMMTPMPPPDQALERRAWPWWDVFSEALARRATELNAAGGGYLYFPPGPYFLSTGFAVLPRVTVIFAAGAVLTMPRIDVPRDDNTAFARRVFQLSVLIQGGIQAGLHQIVAPTVVGGVSNFRAGLLFETDTIREVYPEWWGARSSDIDSHAEIQSAIDAAIHSRPSGTSIPIKLTGRYKVSAPLRIGGDVVRPIFPDAARRPFVLRGAAGPQIRGLATLEAHESFPAVLAGSNDAKLEESSLLIVRGPAGFLIEDVAFGASEVLRAGRILRRNAAGMEELADVSVEVGKVFSCLRLERLDRGGSDAQMSRVRRCFFKGALGVLVQIGEFTHPYRQSLTPRGSQNGDGAQDLLGLVFEACKFSHEATIAPPLQTHPEDLRRQVWEERAAVVDWLRDGVYFRANNTLRLHFIDCFWRGGMRAGVRAYGCSVVFTNLNTHLTRMPVPREVCLRQDARYTSLFRPDADPSTLWAWADRRWVPSNVVDPLLPFQGDRFVDARDNGCDIYVEAAPSPTGPWLYHSGGVSVTSCESQSWRFLSSYPRSDLNDDVARPSYDVYLQDVHASNASSAPVAQSDSTRVVIVPPSIEWLGPFWNGGSVTVSGLMVNNNPQRRDLVGDAWFLEWSGRIVVELSRSRARIVDLGSRNSFGYFRGTRGGSEGNTQTYYKLGISLDGPEPLNRGTPWYLNLQVAPSSLPGGP